MEILYFSFFSGMTKLNIYYGAQKIDIIEFKKRYIIRFVLPIVLVTTIFLYNSYSVNGILSSIILIGFITYMDMSSWLLSQKMYFVSQIGEYFIGRIFIFVSIIFLLFNKIDIDITKLLIVYLMQALIIVSFFSYILYKNFNISIKVIPKGVVDIKKLINFQESDFFLGIISYMPVLIQYFSLEAFNTGILAIYLTFNKVITFVSGPTAKVFLPRFSQYYMKGRIEDICRDFEQITKIQYIYLSLVSIICLYNLSYILSQIGEFSIFINPLLLLIVLCIISTSLGPMGGLLQMIGCDGVEKKIKFISLLSFVIVLYITYGNQFFIFYGLMTQISIETLSYLIIIIIKIGKYPVVLSHYFQFILIMFLLFIEHNILKYFEINPNITIIIEALTILIIYIKKYKKDICNINKLLYKQ